MDAKPLRFVVEVLQPTTAKAKYYTVQCHNPDDAMQLAFALDGGWGKDSDASDMLELAKSYARIVKGLEAR